LRTCEPDFRGLRNLKRQKLALDEVTVRERTPEAEPDYLKLTGETPMSMADFVKLHAAEFTRSEATV